MTKINPFRQAQGKPQKVIVIVGPTASGKSDLALRLAKLAPSFAKATAGRQGKQFKKRGYLGAEIISADSRQVYRGMDIGTGKVTKKELKIIKHHLIDVTSPKKQFTVDDFKKLGEKAMADIASRHKLPIIVGGTGFYIDILLGRMAITQVPPDKRLRAELEKQSAEQLFGRLSDLDPMRTKNIDRYNRHRLIRALEIYLATKKSSVKPVCSVPDSRYDILWLGLDPGKDKLARNIKKRLDQRLSEGMRKEVEKLHDQGVSWKRLDDLGLEYRQISKYLRGTINKKQRARKDFKKSEYYEILLKEIIKYSKRQMTWFKRNTEINWINKTEEANRLLETFL